MIIYNMLKIRDILKKNITIISIWLKCFYNVIYLIFILSDASNIIF